MAQPDFFPYQRQQQLNINTEEGGAVSVGVAATGKKRAAAADVFPYPAAEHFSDYGFDPQLAHYLSQPETKRSWTRRRHHHQHHPPPPDSARFGLQKPISKKHRSKQQHEQQQRRRWWSFFLFKRPSSRTDPTAGVASPASASAPAPASASGPLYLADDDDDDDHRGGYRNDDSTASCACWAPAMRSGHLAAAELGAASASVPYVNLRNATANLGRGTQAAQAAMPIYLVT